MAWPNITERALLHPNAAAFLEQREEEMGEHPDLPPHPRHTADPFADDEEIVASCDLENPESCESCQ